MRVPEIRGGAHVLGRTLLHQPAGKAVNVSRCLARMGCDNRLVGFVGHHEQAWFTQYLHAMKPGRIDCHWLALPQATRESITLIDTATDQDMHIREAGFTLDAGHWQQLGDCLLHGLSPDDWIVLAGSPPSGISTEQILELLGAIGEKGAQSVVDTSGPVLTAVLRRPLVGLQLVKPNLHEFAQAIDQPDLTFDTLPKAVLAAATHIPWLLVSLGKQGVMVRHRGKLWHGWLPMRQHQVVDTVGCGDAMLAGCLRELLQPPCDVHRLITTGLAAASANATVAGAGNFENHQLLTLAGLCRIKTVSVG